MSDRPNNLHLYTTHFLTSVHILDTYRFRLNDQKPDVAKKAYSCGTLNKRPDFGQVILIETGAKY